MHEKVAAYLEQQRGKEAAFRAKKLMELGICQRVYMPEGAKFTADMAQEYPHEEDGRRFRVEPVPVTDEEWAAICGALRQEYGFRRRKTQNSNENNNHTRKNAVFRAPRSDAARTRHRQLVRSVCQTGISV